MTFENMDAEQGLPSLALILVDELNHRVINEYCEAISALSLVARDHGVDAPGVIAAAAVRLRAYAEAHRALAPPRENRPLNVSQHLSEVFGRLAQGALSDRALRITLRSDDIWMSPERAWKIGLILAELVRNACRHGLAGTGGAIAVRISDKPEGIVCLVADNGAARPGARPGRGNRLVRAIAASLKGEVDWFLSPAGSLVRLRLAHQNAAIVAPARDGQSIRAG